MKLFSYAALVLFGLSLAGCGDSSSAGPGGSAAGTNSAAGSNAGGGSSSTGGSGHGGSTSGSGGEAHSSCAPNPCLNGTCTEHTSDSATFSCICDSGFTGTLCDAVATDACTTGPCQNGGSCTLSATGAALCACAAGYSGADCATNIDDCAAHPCQNGGTCADGVNDFTCTCPAGVTGKTCSGNTDDCAVNPCVNGGLCADRINDFNCACAAGYNGKTCSNNIDDCAVNPCANGGACTDKVNDFSCACLAGYSGKTCATNIDDCAPNLCANGGACTDKVNGFSCACVAGYSGTTCGTNIDDCAAAPCLNGGSCTDGVDSFSCACAANYSGPICATFTTPTSCKAIKTASPAAGDGNYTIDPDGAGPFDSLSVWCDMTTDGGGYTSYAIDGGISTTRFDEANSCNALGLAMVIPRTQAHLNALFSKYTMSYFQIVPGVYGLAAGDYRGCAMNSSDATCGANWKALDGGAWFARNATYGEPNGDYTAGCWLGAFASIDPDVGFLAFNDGNCGYSSGPSYLCSDNAK